MFSVNPLARSCEMKRTSAVSEPNFAAVPASTNTEVASKNSPAPLVFSVLVTITTSAKLNRPFTIEPTRLSVPRRATVEIPASSCRAFSASDIAALADAGALTLAAAGRCLRDLLVPTGTWALAGCSGSTPDSLILHVPRSHGDPAAHARQQRGPSLCSGTARAVRVPSAEGPAADCRTCRARPTAAN